MKELKLCAVLWGLFPAGFQCPGFRHRKFSAIAAGPNQPGYLPMSDPSFQGFVKKSVGTKCLLCVEGWPSWIPAFGINRYLRVSLCIFVSVVSSFVTWYT